MTEPTNSSDAETILTLYNIICNLELLAVKKYPKYPYNLKDNIEFTQNQLTIYYKENYRKDKMGSKIGSNQLDTQPNHDISIIEYI
jgi:hypothetical protein